MARTFMSRLWLYLTAAAVFILILIIIKGIIYSIIEDSLPSAEDPSFVPGAKSIFFHDTSCRGGLTIRQACSVEAAARAHPEHIIYVLFSCPVTNYAQKTTCLATLLEFPNVKFLRVDITEFSKGTAVQSIVLNDIKLGLYPKQHAADILRMLTLNKWGGIYLDTDMIVTRSLEHFPKNFVAKENLNDVASGILSFAKDGIGANITNKILEIMGQDYNPTGWSTFGPAAIDKVLKMSCPQLIHSANYQTAPMSNCHGITVFTSELFYPYYYTEIEDIFSAPTEDFHLEEPYAYHMWDFVTHNISIHKDTVYEIVAGAFCPTIHDTYRDEFCVVV
ncbi:lactosylceramide 4-alpha-galactosyltransferase [Helicoverpa armigera]|uniref:lactosylceramide 4-alpha-galactosyltransferase n=1 Tax=Helicoverpa armigera TaxID=29058 RepID=UPI00308304A5